jgi:glucose/arabinose dehydrogenase
LPALVVMSAARWIALCVIGLAMCLVGGSGCYGMMGSEGGGDISKETAMKGRRVDPSHVSVPDGYRIEVVATGLTYPTGVAFGDGGRVFVVESGYSYGESFMVPRLVEVDRRGGGVIREIARGEHGPWNGVAYHRGGFYVAEGGATTGGRILRIDQEGNTRVLVDDLPSLGDHHTNGPAIGPDGKVYFGQGTVTNSGVVGEDSHAFGWLARNPRVHDVPCRDVTLRGTNFKTDNPMTKEKDEIETGAFSPFGTATSAGQVVKGALPCNGAIMRVAPEGGDLELVAWGMRNPFGLAFAADGQLYVTDNGYDVRGSRPVFGSADMLWKVKEGSWYGWPDYSEGRPLDMDFYAEAGGDPKGLVLAEHPARPPAPVALFPVHSSADGIDIARGGRFGYSGHAFVALFGDMTPSTGKVMAPVGFMVVRVDLETGVIEDFARNRGDEKGPATDRGDHGLERPVAVRFDPTGGELYVVDFGVMRMTGKGPEPQPETGVLWRIVRDGGGS